MSDIDLISVSNEDVQTINVEISNLTNSVDVEFGQNIAATIDFHNQSIISHPYLVEKLAGKVDIETGKGLSQNDFTDEIKNTYDSSISDIQSDISNIQSNISEIQGDISDIENSLVIATQDQALTGTDDTTIMTPLKVKQSVENSLPQIYFKESYESGTSGYRIWSDGYCEQWGYIDFGAAISSKGITLLKSYKDTSYQAFMIRYAYLTGNVTNSYVAFNPVSGNYFEIWCTGNYWWNGWWKASGYLAEGEY